MHVAMWSGPRNLSTALMYSFAARDDFNVVDEPFYGAFLKATGIDHPMRAEILESMELDPQHVPAAWAQAGPEHLYTKQMTHHMLPGFPENWFAQARHVFLIRHPVRVIASYRQKRGTLTADDLGFDQQDRLYKTMVDRGLDPVVVDSFDIRRDPATALEVLCTAIGLPWTPQMLSWAQGGIPEDGAWAPHWYGAVHASTGFAGPEGPLPLLTPEDQRLADSAMPIYDALSDRKI